MYDEQKQKNYEENESIVLFGKARKETASMQPRSAAEMTRRSMDMLIPLQTGQSARCGPWTCGSQKFPSSREEEVHCWLQRRKIGIQVCSCGFTMHVIIRLPIRSMQFQQRKNVRQFSMSPRQIMQKSLKELAKRKKSSSSNDIQTKKKEHRMKEWLIKYSNCLP
ncbi:hypothetical protein T4C_6359 [Trichinella pseudospiralis]|uniref:Uncharacterized protein n=1 Tax=Trichinella pseudospiralis TaxID=6337 RepID=A0A0V1JD53_TRIPS|nr:hypothetical protein T4C_6359 [Trichinella pseudospiralis]